MSETVTVRRDDLDTLVAACTSYLPADVSPEAGEAFGRLLKGFDEAHSTGQEEPATPVSGGQFMHIAFMGRVELTGYVTEITVGGEPGFHIDLPGKLWGGNPLAWEEYSAKVLFSRRPLTEEFVRRAWEASLRAAEKRRQQEAEWARMQEQRAIADGRDEDSDTDEDLDDEDDPF